MSIVIKGIYLVSGGGGGGLCYFDELVEMVEMDMGWDCNGKVKSLVEFTMITC